MRSTVSCYENENLESCGFSSLYVGEQESEKFCFHFKNKPQFCYVQTWETVVCELTKVRKREAIKWLQCYLVNSPLFSELICNVGSLKGGRGERIMQAPRSVRLIFIAGKHGGLS